MDPCLLCRLLPMSEQLLCLAELDLNSTLKPGQLDVAPLRTRKRKPSVAAGAPLPFQRATSRSDEHSRIEENSLSKMVSVLSSLASACHICYTCEDDTGG
ncbi:hypothetical protein ABG768_024592 [Culter alburnus]|uniref:Uncharacterized protein n=1 Tax=Culter alburnus TaxID=194366 RepID=A0AAW2AJN4_CULAL